MKTTKENIDELAEKACSSGLQKEDAEIAAALIRGSRETFATAGRWPDISSYPKHIREYVKRTREERD
jgi:hypothetical protein